MSRPTILGYVRPDGRVGIRNYLLVMSTVVCSSFVARRIADQVQAPWPLRTHLDAANLSLTWRSPRGR